MIHSFYAGMGGFIMELDSSPENQGRTFILGDQHLTISDRGIEFLGRCGHLPSLAEEYIVIHTLPGDLRSLSTRVNQHPIALRIDAMK